MKRTAASIALLLLGIISTFAQPDTSAQGMKRSFVVDANVWSRGEYRNGGLPADNGRPEAVFLMSNAIVQMNYKAGFLEMCFSPKFFGIWGSSSTGALKIDEAWAGFRLKNGLFLRAGRQKLEYDDERIIGNDDWTMAINSQDILKAGFEHGRHKLHLLVAFNQNDENTNGGTIYIDGSQPYKSMQTLWYHFDPIPQLGASLVVMNTGMQNPIEAQTEINKVEYQQIFGAFADWHPSNFSLTASYYRQTGRNEHHLPIQAWMTSAEALWNASPQFDLGMGYFFMSGDEYYYVPPEGAFGLSLKKDVRGFNPIFGSHHEFYGAMDFFYVKTYYGGNTPGLQDLHLGMAWRPAPQLGFDAKYHLLATGIKLQDIGRILGHELELNVSWKPMKDLKLMAGYSFMKGTRTMEHLKRTSNKNNLHWGWLMLVVTPEFFRSGN